MAEVCEVKIRGKWEQIALDDALRLDSGRVKRCPECHGQVRAHKPGKDGMVAHFEHFERHPGCYLGDCFDGRRRPHRKALT